MSEGVVGDRCYALYQLSYPLIVRGAGIEPATTDSQCLAEIPSEFSLFSRGGRIRTGDLLTPSQAS